MAQQALPALTVRDLNPLYEGFSLEDDEHGNPIFLYSSFGYVTSDYVAYFGHLPDEEVYPPAPSTLTIVPIQEENKLFVKDPKLNTAFIGTQELPKLSLQEAETLETIACRPHPDIVRYHGCVIRRGHIVGLGLEGCDHTLEERLRTGGVQDFDIDTFMKKITSAVKHLRSMGLAHNDINPSNVMLKERESVLIDFGSCQPFGHTLITPGTTGWVEGDFTVSAMRHGDFALGKIRGWLEGKVCAM